MIEDLDGPRGDSLLLIMDLSCPGRHHARPVEEKAAEAPSLVFQPNWATSSPAGAAEGRGAVADGLLLRGSEPPIMGL